MVPQTFWLYDGNEPIGYGRIRHYLNDNLKIQVGILGMLSGSPSEERVMEMRY